MSKIIKEWRWIAIAIMFVSLGALAWIIAGSLSGVASVGLFSALLRIVSIPILVATLFISLRIRDRLAGINWQRTKVTILSTPMSATIYASSWVLAIAVIIASL